MQRHSNRDTSLLTPMMCLVLKIQRNVVLTTLFEFLRDGGPGAQGKSEKFKGVYGGDGTYASIRVLKN
jgi:hypothetical protein